MNALQLLRAHRYSEAISACQERLTANPDDVAAAGIMAMALRAVGAYEDALPFFERSHEYESKKMMQQIQRWRLNSKKVRAITYDADGNVYYNFGF